MKMSLSTHSLFFVVLFLLCLFLQITQINSCVAYADPSDEDVLPEKRQNTNPLDIPLRLGDLYFPTSGSEEAKPYFKNGLLLLHNFWYDLASDYFREAQKIDPSYGMAYWGEAMSQNQQLWLTENVALSASIMSKIPSDAPLDEREHLYIEAANSLFSSKPLKERYFEYSDRMENISLSYPSDLDAHAFYALSRLSLYTWGLVSQKDWLETEFENVYDILIKVNEENPEHPGGPHYIIHACDDPYNAEDGLEASYEYPRIASDVPHAHHMPSHIYYRFGMWNESLDGDLISYNVSVWFADQIGNTPSCGYDWHSLRFAVYSELQKGEWTNAKNNIQTVKDLNDDYYYFQYINALESSSYIIETQDYDSSFIPALIECPECTDTRDSNSYFHWTHMGNAAILTAQGLSALDASEYDIANETIRTGQEYEKQLKETEPYYANLYGIAWRQIAAALDMYTADEGAESWMYHYLNETILLQDEIGLPHDGPPIPIQPVHEFYGNVLLYKHQYQSALDHYEDSLQMIQGRARSLLGKARALEFLGNSSGAAETYQQLLYQYYEADQDIEPYQEASSYVNYYYNGITTESDDSESSSDDSMGVGLIIIVIVVIVVASLLVALGIYLVKKRRSVPKRDKLMMDSDINYLYA